MFRKCVFMESCAKFNPQSTVSQGEFSVTLKEDARYFSLKNGAFCLPGVVVHIFNTSTGEVEAGQSLNSRPSWSKCEFQTSHGCTGVPCLIIHTSTNIFGGFMVG